jgi:hypothetical protein
LALFLPDPLTLYQFRALNLSGKGETGSIKRLN